MSDAIKVNNNQFSWGSIIAKFRGSRFTGFTGISFADKRERVKAYGMGRHQAPRGRSRGKYTVEPVKLTGYPASFQQLRSELALGATDGRSYADVEFQLIVQYIDTGENDINVEIDGVVWSSNSVSHEESPDPMKEEVELDAMLIRRNGLVLFDQVQGGIF